MRIADNGHGIPDTEIETLERGYETSLDHTSGLGLWLVNWFEESSPRGSVVGLRFERARADSSE